MSENSYYNSSPCSKILLLAWFMVYIACSTIIKALLFIDEKDYTDVDLHHSHSQALPALHSSLRLRRVYNWSPESITSWSSSSLTWPSFSLTHKQALCVVILKAGFGSWYTRNVDSMFHNIDWKVKALDERARFAFFGWCLSLSTSLLCERTIKTWNQVFLSILHTILKNWRKVNDFKSISNFDSVNFHPQI